MKLLGCCVASICLQPKAYCIFTISNIPVKPILIIAQLCGHIWLTKGQKMRSQTTNGILGYLCEEETPNCPKYKISKLSVQFCSNPGNFCSTRDWMGPSLTLLSRGPEGFYNKDEEY